MLINKPAVKMAIIIANVSFILMAFFGIIRIFERASFIPYIYNLSDMLWIYSVTLLLTVLPIRNKLLKFLLISIPYFLVIGDELLQKYSHFYVHPSGPIASLFVTGTYDFLDIVFYTLGYTLAILTSFLVFKFIKSRD